MSSISWKFLQAAAACSAAAIIAGHLTEGERDPPIQFELDPAKKVIVANGEEYGMGALSLLALSGRIFHNRLTRITRSRGTEIPGRFIAIGLSIAALWFLFAGMGELVDEIQ